jgi:DNA ligase-1
MDQFSTLFLALDTTTKTNIKLKALFNYFANSSETDTLWALWLLSGNTVRRAVTSTQLKDWAAEAANIPRWLFDESYIRVGDLGETVSLLLVQTRTNAPDLSLTAWMNEIAALHDQSESRRKAYITGAWERLNQSQRFLFTKLITGSFRVGVSRGLVIRALAGHLNTDAASLQHALTGNWHPLDTTLQILIDSQGANIHPYPFFLASPVKDVAKLGNISDWQYEWKWDGIRGQIVKRDSQIALWSRGEELVSQQFPELIEASHSLPDGTVIDGEIMPWRDGALPFAILQTRLGRKTVTPRLIANAPVAFIAYDLLEHNGIDIRQVSQDERRNHLEEVVENTHQTIFQISPLLHAASWDEFAKLQMSARTHRTEGLMIKRRSSPYRVGRVRGDWWKWKVAPLSVDAVMINAQRGHGRRSGVYSDYTFAVRDGEQLVPFAKAYSGLSDAEIALVDQFVKRHTLEKFGPVRSVTATLVFEIGFEGIAASNRHKSGVAVRFPRILRPRPDKPVEEIDTIETLQQLLKEFT